MTKLFIPACGDRLTLVKPWTFTLYLERRNVKFAEELGLKEKTPKGSWASSVYAGGNKLKTVEVTLPSGTELEIDRLYIRTFNKARIQEGDDYDSVTFKVVQGGKGKRNQRFWVKLSSTADVEYKLDSDSLYRDRVKTVKAVMDN
jgi:hypothetical protein